MSALLEARQMSAGYLGHPVVHEVDIQVNEGEIVCLLGANGAGKTTTMLALSGELAPLAGETLVAGKRTARPLHWRARHGVSYVTEERSIFKELTMRENLRVGGVSVEDAVSLFPELERCVGRLAGLMSGGEQQMLTLARALSRSPSVLLADELSLGLAPRVIERLLGAIRHAATESGTGALVVEQQARRAISYADRVYVMRRGRIVLALGAAEARERMSEIEEAYLASE